MSDTVPDFIRSGFPEGASFHKFAPPRGDGEAEHAMAYVEAGEGSPVLFVHGNPTWSWMYRNAMRALAGSHRCIAVDHVGMGRSDKPATYPYRLDRHAENLLALVRHFDLNDVTLVVHDWGGPIGLLAATREPGRFSKLVLSNTAAFRSERMPWQIGLARSPVGGLLVRGPNLFVRGLMRQGVANPSKITSAIRSGYVWPYPNWNDRVALHRFVQDVPTTPKHPSWPHLVEVEEGLAKLAEKPTLLLWGERDWCFGPPFLKEFQERLPQAETVTLPAAHLVMEDEPERYCDALKQFVGN
ncbi:alpha/beta fold hydrolase [Alienimonas chondri]|uniref:Haloalkane dehalogenase 2 n=1 Tax=Alienimonas chondri TaxID=2681879 RepID=A0ABX1VFU5_9PLAN|nr:alpha/beta fold hydrolase [Alienimonas chondri]NNJ26138.1 Haloalkane dehalogenase 2 [Alienimonas chondri]